MVRVGGGWDTLQHFLERHGADPVQQISAADLLPMDTRPAQCSARKRHPINGSTMNSLSASTMTLNQAAGSHVAAAAAVAHHAAGHGNVLVNSTQQLLGLPIGHLSAAAAVAAAAVSGNNTGVALNGSSNESYSSVTIESNMFNRCVSVTPLLSSPEPASSGYCSSNNSNCTLSISSISKISSTSMAFRRAPSTITSTSNSEPRRRSNSTVSVSTKKSTLSSYKSSATNGSVAHNRYAGSSIPRAHSVLSNNLLSTSQSPNFNAFKVPNRSATKTRIPVLQSPRPESNKSGPTSPGQLQRSRSTSICSPPTTTTHFGFRAGARSALCVRPALAGNPTNVESPTLALNHSTSNNSIIKPANTSRQSRIPTAIGKFGSTSNTNLSGCNRSRIPIFSTGTMSQPTSPSLDKRKSVSRSRRSSANSGPLIGFYSSSNTQLTVSIDSIGSIDSAKTSVRYSNSGSNQSLRRSSTGLTRSLVKLPSTASFHSPTSPSSARSESQPASKGSPSTFGLSNPNSRKKSPASPRLASTSPSVTLNVLGRTSLSAF